MVQWYFLFFFNLYYIPSSFQLILKINGNKTFVVILLKFNTFKYLPIDTLSPFFENKSKTKLYKCFFINVVLLTSHNWNA